LPLLSRTRKAFAIGTPSFDLEVPEQEKESLKRE